MAGTRGLGRFRGEQLNQKIMRDYHFDVNNKIAEDKINILWHNHREILEDTKVDVWVQKNNVNVDGLGSIEVTADLAGRPVANALDVEGVVLEVPVEIRVTGSDDFPYMDSQGNPVYGKLRFEEATSQYFLDFYTKIAGVETPFSFGAGEPVEFIDYRYALRTNLSILPVDAIINGGAGFVEGATDASAYMNLIQLMKDVYGAAGTLDNDGNANLAMSLKDQIAKEVQDRADADQAIYDDLAATTGADLIGVITDPNYTGLTVQDVLADLAARTKYLEENGGAEVTATHTRDTNSANGYFQTETFTTLEDRLVDIETVVDTQVKDHEDRIVKLETEDEREVYEAVGGETGYNLQKGIAKPNTLFISLNGALQAPGINYDEVKDTDGNVTGITFAPETLKIVEGVPDVLFMWYKKVL